MRRVLLLLTLVGASGCAFTNVPVKLPETSVQTGLSGGDGRRIVVVVPFTDDRSNRARCGIQKNSYNAETAVAECSNDPARVLATLLNRELESAGFSTKSSADSPNIPRVEGSLLKFFVEPVIGFSTVTLETDVHVKLTVTSESGLVGQRSFFVKGTASGLGATAGNFQSSVDDATRRIVKEMTAAVISLVNRYPQLGSNEPSPFVSVSDRR